MPARQPREGIVADLLAIARSSTAQGAVWAYGGADLNANLILLAGGDGVAGHVNAEVDVLLVGLLGEGFVIVDGRRLALGVGQAIIIPKGAHRAIESVSERFGYLTCHRRRTGLQPGRRPRTDDPRPPR